MLGGQVIARMLKGEGCHQHCQVERGGCYASHPRTCWVSANPLDKQTSVVQANCMHVTVWSS